MTKIRKTTDEKTAIQQANKLADNKMEDLQLIVNQMRDKAKTRTLADIQSYNINNRYKVYLAGPISGTSYEECVDWREYVSNKFPDEIAGYSPMRGTKHLQAHKVLHGSYEEWPLSAQRGMFSRDYNDCTKADVVLVNLLGTKIVSIGTVMEIAWAYSARVPVVLAMETIGNIHNHPLLIEASPFIVPSIDEAIDIVKSILLN